MGNPCSNLFSSLSCNKKPPTLSNANQNFIAIKTLPKTNISIDKFEDHLLNPLKNNSKKHSSLFTANQTISTSNSDTIDKTINSNSYSNSDLQSNKMDKFDEAFNLVISYNNLIKNPDFPNGELYKVVLDIDLVKIGGKEFLSFNIRGIYTGNGEQHELFSKKFLGTESGIKLSNLVSKSFWNKDNKILAEYAEDTIFEETELFSRFQKLAVFITDNKIQYCNEFNPGVLELNLKKVQKNGDSSRSFFSTQPSFFLKRLGNNFYVNAPNFDLIKNHIKNKIIPNLSLPGLSEDTNLTINILRKLYSEPIVGLESCKYWVCNLDSNNFNLNSISQNGIYRTKDNKFFLVKNKNIIEIERLKNDESIKIPLIENNTTLSYNEVNKFFRIKNFSEYQIKKMFPNLKSDKQKHLSKILEDLYSLFKFDNPIIYGLINESTGIRQIDNKKVYIESKINAYENYISKFVKNPIERRRYSLSISRNDTNEIIGIKIIYIDINNNEYTIFSEFFNNDEQNSLKTIDISINSSQIPNNLIENHNNLKLMISQNLKLVNKLFISLKNFEELFDKSIALITLILENGQLAKYQNQKVKWVILDFKYMISNINKLQANILNLLSILKTINDNEYYQGKTNYKLEIYKFIHLIVKPNIMYIKNILEDISNNSKDKHNSNVNIFALINQRLEKINKHTELKKLYEYKNIILTGSHKKELNPKSNLQINKNNNELGYSDSLETIQNYNISYSNKQIQQTWGRYSNPSHNEVSKTNIPVIYYITPIHQYTIYNLYSNGYNNYYQQQLRPHTTFQQLARNQYLSPQIPHPQANEICYSYPLGRYYNTQQDCPAYTTYQQFNSNHHQYQTYIYHNALQQPAVSNTPYLQSAENYNLFQESAASNIPYQYSHDQSYTYNDIFQQPTVPYNPYQQQFENSYLDNYMELSDNTEEFIETLNYLDEETNIHESINDNIHSLAKIIKKINAFAVNNNAHKNFLEELKIASLPLIYRLIKALKDSNNKNINYSDELIKSINSEIKNITKNYEIFLNGNSRFFNNQTAENNSTSIGGINSQPIQLQLQSKDNTFNHTSSDSLSNSRTFSKPSFDPDNNDNTLVAKRRNLEKNKTQDDTDLAGLNQPVNTSFSLKSQQAEYFESTASSMIRLAKLDEITFIRQEIGNEPLFSDMFINLIQTIINCWNKLLVKSRFHKVNIPKLHTLIKKINDSQKSADKNIINYIWEILQLINNKILNTNLDFDDNLIKKINRKINFIAETYAVNSNRLQKKPKTHQNKKRNNDASDSRNTKVENKVLSYLPTIVKTKDSIFTSHPALFEHYENLKKLIDQLDTKNIEENQDLKLSLNKLIDFMKFLDVVNKNYKFTDKPVEYIKKLKFELIVGTITNSLEAIYSSLRSKNSEYISCIKRLTEYSQERLKKMLEDTKCTK